MNIINIIDKKSKSLSLSKEEINYFVKGVIEGYVEDYQTSALLMAIKLNGFDDQELIHYARALVESGETLPLGEELVDKHSSGGVGDKTSIALLPVLGAMGLKVFKMSGRGLGFTGGTVDKLESMEGFKSGLSIEDVNQMVDEIGISITGQTPKLTPADGALYALRDVTATVDSQPLIAASIISKKIASGAKNILIDLKVGTGAFTPTVEAGEELARLMKLIAADFDRNLFVLFSTMDQPLGRTAGNRIEVNEATKFLAGNGDTDDFAQLIEKICIELYSKSKGVSLEEAADVYNEVIKSGKALELQKVWFNKHGVVEFEKETSYEPSVITEVPSPATGFVSFKDTKAVGNALVELKAGRKTKQDELNFISGIKFNVKQGEEVKEGETLFTIGTDSEVPQNVIDALLDNYVIDNNKKEPKVILGEVSW